MKKVTLEPELAEEAELLTPGQRIAMAKKLERWARQLRMSAIILRQNAAPRPPPSLKPFVKAKLALN